MIRKLALAALAAGLVATPALAAEKLKVETSKGCSFDISLRPDLAPKHVEQITKLAKEGFYDGIVFHRVIDGFMAQAGDPTGTGTSGSDKPNLKAEFSREPHVRGVCSMARTPNPNSANSQFFICFDDASFLNGQYTVFGEVTAGMDVVDKIKKGPKERNGEVPAPADTIVRMVMASDAR